MSEPIGGGSSIPRFAKRNDIGESTTYKEIRSGRLIAHKIGRRTVIFDSDERQWRENLPKLKADQEE
jgi:hypothetical protein